LEPGKNIYFASDLHLGLPAIIATADRERHFVRWLTEIRDSIEELYLVGDIFDYWFEYREVVPRGFTRFLGKIAEITDSGIPVHLFTGNHDIWIFDYLPSELGITLHRQPVIRDFNGKRFYIGHGDGIGPGDRRYKMLKKIFTNPVLQWLFARLHPNFTVWLAHKWSHASRYGRDRLAEPFSSEEKEWLIRYARELNHKEHFDYFIFGHRHIPLDYPLNKNSRFIYLGDWISHFSYAVFNGESLALKTFDYPKA